MTAPQRPALACADAHPLDPAVLCSKLSGHGGNHDSDGDTTWCDGWASTEETAS